MVLGRGPLQPADLPLAQFLRIGIKKVLAEGLRLLLLQLIPLARGLQAGQEANQLPAGGGGVQGRTLGPIVIKQRAGAPEEGGGILGHGRVVPRQGLPVAALVEGLQAVGEGRHGDKGWRRREAIDWPYRQTRP